MSQRNRAMLRVIEYFAKPLKITEGHSKSDMSRVCVRSYLYPIVTVAISYRFWDCTDSVK